MMQMEWNGMIEWNRMVQWNDAKHVSDEKNSLFCFYCVLFGGESLWAENGCKDMKHLSERIQKHESSKTQIDKAKFVSLQADETTDVSCRSQFVIILRYLKGYKPVERFIAFIDVQDRTAMGLTNVLKEKLNCFCQKERLIAQAYDGAAVMRGSRNGVQSLMKKVYPNVHYVHCYAHQFNLVLKKIPKVCETRWNFRSKIVTCIKENKTKIGECFNKIINDEGWDDTSVWQSLGFKKCLEDLEFNFFLSFFYSILKHVDVLYNILQSSNSNTITIKEAFEKFELSINFVRNSITDNVSGSILNN
ncbi:uncharacterized protein LOC136074671 [Hydra vulgaris]|uniref:Uncharacterized protein LOC136074671 n=1 Tax=Hydra vulgaris TaxID=6087 RepID=A0ABM4B2P3_HYDVU